MTRRFVFSFDVSNQFLADAPQAQDWVKARCEAEGKRRYARGPRGGTYQLVTPPDGWRQSDEPGFTRNVKTFWTRREGRYIRPSRVRPGDHALTFGTFTMPVERGRVILPDGRIVATESKFVNVPFPPAIEPVG